MAPTLVREPFHRDGWVYEEKVDGCRILTYKDGARVRLVSRNGRDHTTRFADIAAAAAKLSARTLVLDGEVAIYDQELRSRFEWLREPDRNAVASRRSSWPSTCCTRTAATSPSGRCTIAAPVAGSELVFHVRRLAPNGLEAWAQVTARGFEGLVAKHEASVYGGRGDEAMAEGEAERLDRRGGPVAAADQRRASGR